MKALIITGMILLIALTACSKPDYSQFATCLSSKEVKMYGAYWCTHCNAQKKLFGDSWKYVTYVECSDPGNQGPTQQCVDDGISAYPTWVFPDGRKIEGQLSMQHLSELSECPLIAEK